ncbi:Mce-associated membrane protein [Amycolatopsis xylanica]|uniref:Mce-associated membrane protein n=1 Tax=Amycolatopsis xylanica TaxID=589385 RepID=A0A1H3Q1I4_9PSEU|nr:hypothetical protein [Amycolatopsis xylanica]SDZ07100.1 Mce-associated membrane protein [Amycolatopsis xylanica]
MTRTPLLVALLVFAGCAGWFAFEAASVRSLDNAALADTRATAEVIDQVGAGVKAVFSYDYANLSRTERAASDVLTGTAVTQYRTDFAAARTQAEAGKLVRTTTIRSIGVQTLRGDDATLLLFLDQQTLHTESNQQESTAAQLTVTAHRTDGRWKLTALTPL